MTKYINPRDEKLQNWIRDVANVDPTYVRRLIIDISLKSAVTIYVEMFASSRMLELEIPQEIEDAKVIILDKENKDD